MNELQVFCYQGNEVRTVEVNGEPWFVLKDVCAILNIENHKDVLKRLDADEVGRFNLPHPQNPDKLIEMVCVNESGLYNVILRSDKLEAKPFRKWVTSEVLPSIRKTGGYGQKVLSPVEMFAMQAQINLDQERRLKAVEQKQAVLDGVMDVMAAPLLAEDGWQEKAQKAINTAVERFQTNHQTFRAELYEDVERVGHVDLETRQTRLRKRMKNAGATATECKGVSKLHVIARDPKLRPVFETLLKQKVIRMAKERGMEY
jgi:prophage antirepressor-like protein